MNELKPQLVDRHNAWEEGRFQSASQLHTRSPQPPSSSDADRRHRSQTPSHRSSRSEQPPEEKRIWYPDLSADKRRYDELTVPQPTPRTQRSPRSERDAILQRQKESEDESRLARNAAYSNNPSPYAYSSHSPMPSPVAVTPQRTASHTSSTGTSDTFDPPPLLPLESPNRRYEDDSTDAETNDDRLYKRVADLTIGRDDSTSFGG